MRPFVILLLVLCLSMAYAASCCLAYNPYDVLVQNLKLYVEGQEFIVKGMAYEPAPLGKASDGGLCSIKETVFGEYKSACFGSDYYDGSAADPYRDPAGPVGPWWKAAWDRDLPQIAATGANTIRIYNMNPFSQHYISGRGKSRYPSAIAKYGALHRPFLDACYRANLKVILPLVTDQSMLTSMPSDQLDEIIEDVIDELGDHPSLLMLQIGNELPLATDATLLANVKARISKAKSYLQQVHNRTLPVTTAVVDDPSTYLDLVAQLKGTIDVFISNAGYRDIHLQSLFDGDGTAADPGWTKLSKDNNLPLLVGEFGMMNQTMKNQEIPDWPNQQWSQIINNVPNGCIGGVFFEWSDEPLKTDPAQQDMGIVKYVEAYDSKSGKGSTEANVWVPDRISQKPLVFSALTQGYQGSTYAQYNYKADPFKLLGRTPDAIPGFPKPSPRPSISQGGGDNINGGNGESSLSSIVMMVLAGVAALGFIVFH